MECIQCGAVVPSGRTTCASCGAQVVRREAATPEDETRRLLAEANLLRIRSRFDEAIDISTRVLRIDPANAGAHSLLGDVYYEQGNYREALGWYKLAVQLNPANPADRKKLNATIDHVFQGAQPEADAEPGDLPDPPTMGADPPPTGQGLRGLILKIQPVHVAIFSASLMLVGILVVLLIFARGDQRTAAAQDAATPPPNATAPTTTTLPGDGSGTPQVLAPRAGIGEINPTPTPVTPPPADPRVGGTPLPGSGFATGVPVPVGNQASAGQNGAGHAPNNDSPAPTVIRPAQVDETQPAPPEGDTRRGQRLQEILAMAVQRSKIPGTKVNGVRVEPETGQPGHVHVTLEYQVPPMGTPRDSKMALVYSGFVLVWAVMQEDPDASSFFLRGYAYPDPKSEPKKLFLADVSRANADKARTAKDYKTAMTFLTLPHWEPPLQDADVN